MIQIEEIASKELPPIITGSYGIEYDINEVKRNGFILGANTVLQEIENILSLGYNTMTTVDLIVDKVKELKGE